MNLDEGTGPAECVDMFGASERRRISGPREAPGARSAALARLIETDVIPRLMLARETAPAEPAHGRSLDVKPNEIDDLAAMMVALDLRGAHRVVTTALASGATLEALMLDLLSPAAKRLGEMWVDDEITFTDVTVGLCALQNLLRSVTSGDAGEPRTLIDARALIAAAPGEQHTFGVLMLETMFRKAGWDTVGMPIADGEEICTALGRRDFAIAGFSLSRESALGDLAALIRDARSASRNKNLTVMVGGRVFNDSPALVREVGADLTARDGRAAVVASQYVVCSRVQTH